MHDRTSLPVYLAGQPIGEARTRAAALHLAFSFLDPTTRQLLKAGFRIHARRGSDRFSLSLAR